MYDKNYYEEYARLTLEDIFPYDLANFSHADKPDIQNKIDSIGIEVTRAECSSLIQTSQYAKRFHGEKPSRKVIDRFHGEFFFNKKGIVIGHSPSKGFITPCTVEQIVFALKGKKKKCPSYEQFSKMGVYFFTSLFEINDQEIQELKALDISPYDFIIVNSGNLIYMIENHQIRQVNVSKKLAKFKSAAKEYSSRC